jgi:hypothetical protein
METIMQIQVRINEEGALRNQRYAFSDKFTLVSELLQNARRAGATRVEIDHDAATKTLRVADNGDGIDDFQKLLTLNESGWDAATRDEEQPFGIGFSKCLYSAVRCVVTSRAHRVDFETAAALARTPIDVTTVSGVDGMASGTVIELHGVELPELDTRIATMCQGFPVTVVFNGKTLERPFAADKLPLTATPVGAVYLTGTSDGKQHHNTLVFLQGFCVMKPIYHQLDNVNVVHLDSRQFVARLPDRDKLIDEEDQRKRIDTALNAAWRQVLETAKAALPAGQFVETYYAAMRARGHLDLINDVDGLPSAVCDDIVSYPYQQRGGDCDYLRTSAVVPTRQAIERGEVTLIALDPVDEENIGRWMFARARGHVVFNSIGLHPDHWVQRHVRYPEDEALKVEALEERTRATLDGRWVWLEVVLCRVVRVRVGDECAEIADDGVFHDGTLYIPDGEATGLPVRQASDFTDPHDQFLEADLDADQEALADLIRRLRSVEPRDTLDSLVQELKLEKYALLHGRTFRLTVGPVSNSHLVELVS